MSRLLRNFALALFIVTGFGAIAEQAEARPQFMPGAKNCPAQYAVWKLRKSFRWSAFALNTWNGSGQACGYTYRYSTKARALAGALRKCIREERVTSSGRRGTCRVLGVK